MSVRGTYIWLVGPDGSGKSTLAAGVDPDDSEIVYWRASVLPMAKQLIGQSMDSDVNSTPHARQPDRAARALARLLYYAVDNVLGYWFRVRPVVKTGRNIIVDRGWADMTVDSRRYGFASPRLPRVLMRVLPRPDALVVVRVAARTAHERKPELSIEEIERQYRQWDLLHLRGVRKIEIDNECSPHLAAEQFGRAIDDLRSTS
ncbi:MAG: Thymidylate kinaselike protein [Nocardioides sp.]|nr:Thymidylate kinaselike protein [Nocardioides sp.]